MGTFAVILPAAGRSTRFGDPNQKKIHADLAGRAVWLRAVDPFASRADVGRIILAVAPEDRPILDERFRNEIEAMRIIVIDGGAERHDSVARALSQAGPDCEFVAVHDAARPCVATPLIDAVFDACRRHGAALPGVPISDTIKRVNAHGIINETVDRAGLFAVQTPQAFRRDWLETAYARRHELAAGITDDAQLIEALGHPCHVVPGARSNLKITTREDLEFAAAVLALDAQPKR